MPLNKCVPIGESFSEYCPKDMVLEDGPDNVGYCDCQENAGTPFNALLYSYETGKCHRQFSQVYILNLQYKVSI